MAKGWIDAEFEVVDGPRRLGDPHPRRKRWLYAGVGARGQALWYRPPRLNRWRYFLALAAALICAWLLLILSAWALHRLRAY